MDIEPSPVTPSAIESSDARHLIPPRNSSRTRLNQEGSIQLRTEVINLDADENQSRSNDTKKRDLVANADTGHADARDDDAVARDNLRISIGSGKMRSTVVVPKDADSSRASSRSPPPPIAASEKDNAVQKEIAGGNKADEKLKSDTGEKRSRRSRSGSNDGKRLSTRSTTQQSSWQRRANSSASPKRNVYRRSNSPDVPSRFSPVNRRRMLGPDRRRSPFRRFPGGQFNQRGPRQFGRGQFGRGQFRRSMDSPPRFERRSGIVQGRFGPRNILTDDSSQQATGGRRFVRRDGQGGYGARQNNFRGRSPRRNVYQRDWNKGTNNMNRRSRSPDRDRSGSRVESDVRKVKESKGSPAPTKPRGDRRSSKHRSESPNERSKRGSLGAKGDGEGKEASRSHGERVGTSKRKTAVASADEEEKGATGSSSSSSTESSDEGSSSDTSNDSSTDGSDDSESASDDNESSDNATGSDGKSSTTSKELALQYDRTPAESEAPNAQAKDIMQSLNASLDVVSSKSRHELIVSKPDRAKEGSHSLPATKSSAKETTDLHPNKSAVQKIPPKAATIDPSRKVLAREAVAPNASGDLRHSNEAVTENQKQNSRNKVVLSKPIDDQRAAEPFQLMRAEMVGAVPVPSPSIDIARGRSGNLSPSVSKNSFSASNAQVPSSLSRASPKARISDAVHDQKKSPPKLLRETPPKTLDESPSNSLPKVERPQAGHQTGLDRHVGSERSSRIILQRSHHSSRASKSAVEAREVDSTAARATKVGPEAVSIPKGIDRKPAEEAAARSSVSKGTADLTEQKASKLSTDVKKDIKSPAVIDPIVSSSMVLSDAKDVSDDFRMALIKEQARMREEIKKIDLILESQKTTQSKPEELLKAVVVKDTGMAPSKAVRSLPDSRSMLLSPSNSSKDSIVVTDPPVIDLRTKETAGLELTSSSYRRPEPGNSHVHEASTDRRALDAAGLKRAAPDVADEPIREEEAAKRKRRRKEKKLKKEKKRRKRKHRRRYDESSSESMLDTDELEPALEDEKDEEETAMPESLQNEDPSRAKDSYHYQELSHAMEPVHTEELAHTEERAHAEEPIHGEDAGVADEPGLYADELADHAYSDVNPYDDGAGNPMVESISEEESESGEDASRKSRKHRHRKKKRKVKKRRRRRYHSEESSLDEVLPAENFELKKDLPVEGAQPVAKDPISIPKRPLDASSGLSKAPDALSFVRKDSSTIGAPTAMKIADELPRMVGSLKHIMDPISYQSWVEEEKQRLREQLIRELQQELILPAKTSDRLTHSGGKSSASPSISSHASPDYSSMQVDVEMDSARRFGALATNQEPGKKPSSSKLDLVLTDAATTPAGAISKGASKSKVEIQEEILDLLKSDDESDFGWSDEDWKRQEKPSSLVEQEARHPEEKKSHNLTAKEGHGDKRRGGSRAPDGSKPRSQRDDQDRENRRKRDDNSRRDRDLDTSEDRRRSSRAERKDGKDTDASKREADSSRREADSSRRELDVRDRNRDVTSSSHLQKSSDKCDTSKIKDSDTVSSKRKTDGDHLDEAKRSKHDERGQGSKAENELSKGTSFGEKSDVRRREKTDEKARGEVDGGRRDRSTEKSRSEDKERKDDILPDKKHASDRESRRDSRAWDKESRDKANAEPEGAGGRKEDPSSTVRPNVLPSPVSASTGIEIAHAVREAVVQSGAFWQDQAVGRARGLSSAGKEALIESDEGRRDLADLRADLSSVGNPGIASDSKSTQDLLLSAPAPAVGHWAAPFQRVDTPAEASKATVSLTPTWLGPPSKPSSTSARSVDAPNAGEKRSRRLDDRPAKQVDYPRPLDETSGWPPLAEADDRRYEEQDRSGRRGHDTSRSPDYHLRGSYDSRGQDRVEAIAPYGDHQDRAQAQYEKEKYGVLQSESGARRDDIDVDAYGTSGRERFQAYAERSPQVAKIDSAPRGNADAVDDRAYTQDGRYDKKHYNPAAASINRIPDAGSYMKGQRGIARRPKVQSHPIFERGDDEGDALRAQHDTSEAGTRPTGGHSGRGAYPGSSYNYKQADLRRNEESTSFGEPNMGTRSRDERRRPSQERHQNSVSYPTGGSGSGFRSKRDGGDRLPYDRREADSAHAPHSLEADRLVYDHRETSGRGRGGATHQRDYMQDSRGSRGQGLGHERDFNRGGPGSRGGDHRGSNWKPPADEAIFSSAASGSSSPDTDSDHETSAKLAMAAKIQQNRAARNYRIHKR